MQKCNHGWWLWVSKVQTSHQMIHFCVDVVIAIATSMWGQQMMFQIFDHVKRKVKGSIVAIIGSFRWNLNSWNYKKFKMTWSLTFWRFNLIRQCQLDWWRIGRLKWEGSILCICDVISPYYPWINQNK
jgi:hypothetical protein